MALDLALSSDHDLALDSLGRAAFIDGADRIAQQINVTLQVFLGEWFLDTSFGVPYFEEVLVKSPDRARIEAVLRSRILAVPGVQRVVSFDLAVERRERILRVTYQADTEAGRVSRVLDLRSS